MQAGGQRFESVILHSKEKEYIDILEASQKTSAFFAAAVVFGDESLREAEKGGDEGRKPYSEKKKERRQGHMKDALALGGEEGRDKLR